MNLFEILLRRKSEIEREKEAQENARLQERLQKETDENVILEQRHLARQEYIDSLRQSIKSSNIGPEMKRVVKKTGLRNIEIIESGDKTEVRVLRITQDSWNKYQANEGYDIKYVSRGDLSEEAGSEPINPYNVVSHTRSGDGFAIFGVPSGLGLVRISLNHKSYPRTPANDIDNYLKYDFNSAIVFDLADPLLPQAISEALLQLDNQEDFPDPFDSYHESHRVSTYLDDYRKLIDEHGYFGSLDTIEILENNTASFFNGTHFSWFSPKG